MTKRNGKSNVVVVGGKKGPKAYKYVKYGLSDQEVLKKLAELGLTSYNLIDPKVLKEVCKRSVDSFFKEYAEHVSTGKYKGDNLRYIYIDNGAPVLAVAHLDTVINPRKQFNFNEYGRDGVPVIKCPTLDDRLGVYIILHVLPQLLGENCVDILLTEGEESGQSSAQLFDPGEKTWNWMVEFDRKESSITGSGDVVLYSYADEETKDIIKSFDITVGHGSVSDISYLTKLGCKGFNFAVGYRNYHATNAWFSPPETEFVLEKFKRFYKKLSGDRLEHVHKVAKYTTYAEGYSGGYASTYRPAIGDWVQFRNMPVGCKEMAPEPFIVMDITNNGWSATLQSSSGDLIPYAFSSSLLEEVESCMICGDYRVKPLIVIDANYLICKPCLNVVEVCDECGGQFDFYYGDTPTCMICFANANPDFNEPDQVQGDIAVGDAVMFVMSGRYIYFVSEMLPHDKVFLANGDGNNEFLGQADEGFDLHLLRKATLLDLATHSDVTGIVTTSNNKQGEKHENIQTN